MYEPSIPVNRSVLTDDNLEKGETTSKRSGPAAGQNQYSLRHLPLDMFPFKIAGRASAAFSYCVSLTLLFLLVECLQLTN